MEVVLVVHTLTQVTHAHIRFTAIGVILLVKVRELRLGKVVFEETRAEGRFGLGYARLSFGLFIIRSCLIAIDILQTEEVVIFFSVLIFLDALQLAVKTQWTSVLLHHWIVRIESADGEIPRLRIDVEHGDASAASLSRRSYNDLFLGTLHELDVGLRSLLDRTASAHLVARQLHCHAFLCIELELL